MAQVGKHGPLPMPMLPLLMRFCWLSWKEILGASSPSQRCNVAKKLRSAEVGGKGVSLHHSWAFALSRNLHIFSLHIRLTNRLAFKACEPHGSACPCQLSFPVIHSYCHNPLISPAKLQWFIRMQPEVKVPIVLHIALACNMKPSKSNSAIMTYKPSPLDHVIVIYYSSPSSVLDSCHQPFT